MHLLDSNMVWHGNWVEHVMRYVVAATVVVAIVAAVCVLCSLRTSKALEVSPSQREKLLDKVEHSLWAKTGLGSCSVCTKNPFAHPTIIVICRIAISQNIPTPMSGSV